MIDGCTPLKSFVIGLGKVNNKAKSFGMGTSGPPNVNTYDGLSTTLLDFQFII